MSTADVTTTVTTRPERKISPLSVGSWVLYDLANTIFSLNIVSLYFSLWVVNVMGAGDAAYGFANSISMAVIAASTMRIAGPRSWTRTGE